MTEPNGAGGQRRILYLTHRIPYPPDKGDRIRSYHVLAYLARLGSVDLGTLVDEEVPPTTRQELGRLCRRVLIAPLPRWGRWARAAGNLLRGKSITEGLFFSGLFRRELNAWLRDTEYDSVVCFSSSTLPYVLGRGLGPRLVADLVDVDSQKWFDYAARARRPLAWVFGTEGRRLRRIEMAAAEARAVVFVTEPEADIYRGFCPGAAVEVIPNGVNLTYFQPMPADEQPSCVFVGYLDYRANVLGLEWFCREVWPEIRQPHPDAVFHIVGRNAVPAVLRLEDLPGVKVVGAVPDVRPWVAAARVVVVPLLVARGVQNKVLEALAMARPVVASGPALEGLGVAPGREVLRATTPGEWHESIGALWEDEPRRRALGARARKYVEDHHNWETCLDRFQGLVGEVPGGGGRPGRKLVR